MTIIDFMIKHPIIAMLMFGDLCVLIDNIMSRLIHNGIKGRLFLKERVGNVINNGIEAIEKREKVEIGFHSTDK